MERYSKELEKQILPIIKEVIVSEKTVPEEIVEEEAEVDAGQKTLF